MEAEGKMNNGCQSVEDRNSNSAEQLSKIQAEFDAVKSENQLLLAKMDVLQAQNGELQADLKVVKMEAKLSNEQMTKTVEAKVNEMAVKAEGKHSKTMEVIQQKYEKLESMTNKIVEENTILKKEHRDTMRKHQQKISVLEVKIANKDKKLEYTSESDNEDIPPPPESDDEDIPPPPIGFGK